MTGLNLTYSYDRPDFESEISVIDSFFEKDSLLITASETGSNGDDEADAYIDRQDAIDLAWSILEHYGVTERPPAPLAVGDLVELTGDTISGENNRLGKIETSNPITGSFSVRGLNGEFLGWRTADEVARLTKDEFLAKATARANRLVEED